MTVFITTPVIAGLCVAVFVSVLAVLLFLRYRWRRVHNTGNQKAGYSDSSVHKFLTPQSSFREQDFRDRARKFMRPFQLKSNKIVVKPVLQPVKSTDVEKGEGVVERDVFYGI